MCSLPESLLQPLLQRLHLEKLQRQTGEITAKQFLLNSDPALRSVVAKEALQWRKGSITQVINYSINIFRMKKNFNSIQFEFLNNCF